MERLGERQFTGIEQERVVSPLGERVRHAVPGSQRHIPLRGSTAGDDRDIHGRSDL